MQCFRFIYKKSVQHQNSTNNTYQCNVFVLFIRKADNIKIVQIISINAMFSFHYKKSVQHQNSTNNIYQCNVFVSFIRKAYNIRIVQIISINAMFSFHL